MGERFILEGEWSGYVSSQRRVVHREVVIGKRADRLRNLNSIVYTDGTSLCLSMRPALPRERVNEIFSYASLIRDAEATGEHVVYVANLVGKKKPAGEARDPRDPDPERSGIFRDHNCWKCKDGAGECAEGNPSQCQYPHARND